ncbi:MAG: DUF835 domain-containing protein [Theionarchaea archaeon]|nr:DUF835 domain-containing protein [Theionarchaea archaeon]MBU7037582.1 DUF835 domain-containing protein [Theionarchaea archaeon]
MHLYLIPPAVALVGNAAMGFHLMRRTPSSRVTRAFSFLILLLMGWAFSEIMMRSSPDEETALFWGRILYLNSFFLPSAFVVLAYVYTGGRKRVFTFLPYSTGFFFIWFLFTDNFLVGMEEIPPWGYDAVVGPLFTHFIGGYLGVIAVGTLVLLRYYKKSSFTEKRRLQAMLTGFLLSLVLIAITNLLSRIKDLPLPRMGSMFTLIATLSFAYGILRYQLLIVPTRERAKETLDARCGALCTSCGRYLEGECPSCEQGERGLRESCPIYQCSVQKGVLCESCSLLLGCETYKTHSEQCPFRTDQFGLKARNSYLWEDADPDVAFQIFKDYTIRGSFGLLITREYPEKVREKYDLPHVSVLWLSQLEEHEKGVDPTNLPRLTHTVTQFVRQTPQSFVLLTGLEYLVVHNGFERVLKHVHMINDQVMTHSSRLLVVVDPKTLDPKELSLLQRELRSLKKENLFKYPA